MTIKQQGGIFGRNPSFNDVEVESLTIAGNAVPDASTILVDGDIGSTVQGYDADTTKNDVANAFTENQSILNGLDSTLFLGKGAEGADGVTKIKSYQSGADTDQLGLAFFVHTSGSGSSPTNEAMRIDHNLRLDMVGGGNILLNSGAGIDFSATGDGSGTASSELFDDYEEGTWTPTLGGSTGNPTGVGYTTQAGTYTKMGRQVTVNGRIGFTTFTGGSGNLLMSGLPYAFSNIPRGVANLHNTAYSGYIVSALTGTSIYFFQNVSGPAYTFIPFTGVTSNANLKLIEVTITYFV